MCQYLLLLSNSTSFSYLLLLHLLFRGRKLLKFIYSVFPNSVNVLFGDNFWLLFIRLKFGEYTGIYSPIHGFNINYVQTEKGSKQLGKWRLLSEHHCCGTNPYSIQIVCNFTSDMYISYTTIHLIVTKSITY